MFRIALRAVLIVPLLAALALTAVGSVASDSFLRTEALTLVTGADPEPWCDDAAPDDLADAVLRGAHFSFGLSCRFERAAIPEPQAALSEDLAHMPPAEPGVAFLFAQFASRAAYPPDLRYDAARLTSWIEVGSERLDLDSAPEADDFLILSAPDEAPVVLWVEDAGRAQGLDLRTGERVEPVAAYYEDLEFWTVTVDGYDYVDLLYRNGPGGGWLMCCSYSWAELTRSAWTESLGWAPEGEVFLTVRFDWCGADYNEVEWRLDTDTALIVFSGSAIVAPAEWTVETDEFGAEVHQAVYAVPADTEGFAVMFLPLGEAVEKETGEVFHPVEVPTATSWLVEFA